MPDTTKLLSSTSLICLPQPSLREVRAELRALAYAGKAHQAIRAFRTYFFWTSLANRSDRTKKFMFRSLWNAIEMRDQASLEFALDEGEKDIKKAHEQEKADSNRNGSLSVALDLWKDDMKIRYMRDVTFGMCTYIANTLYSSKEPILEEGLIRLEKVLAR